MAYIPWIVSSKLVDVRRRSFVIRLLCSLITSIENMPPTIAGLPDHATSPVSKLADARENNTLI